LHYNNEIWVEGMCLIIVIKNYHNAKMMVLKIGFFYFDVKYSPNRLNFTQIIM